MNRLGVGADLRRRARGWRMVLGLLPAVLLPSCVGAGPGAVPLSGEAVYWAFIMREETQWSEFPRLWDGQTLLVYSYASHKAYHGTPHHLNPFWWGGGDERSGILFTIDGTTYHWTGKYIPIAVQADPSGVYMAMFDRETPGMTCRFRFYRAASASEWKEIPPAEFPKHLALTNMRFATRDSRELIEKDPADAWFRRSLEAKLWSYLEEPGFNYDAEPSEGFVRRFKARWIKPASTQPVDDSSRLAYLDPGIVTLTAAIQLRPEGAHAYMARACCYATRHEDEKALADFAQAFRLDPKGHETYLSRGVYYLKRGDLEKALADFNEAIGLNRQSEEAYRLRGTVYQNKGDLEKAIADFTEAIEIKPDDSESLIARAKAYEMQGEKSKAAKDFAKAKELGYRDE